MADKRIPTATKIVITYEVPGQDGLVTARPDQVEKDIEELLRQISGSLTKALPANTAETQKVRNRIMDELRDPMARAWALKHLQLLHELTFALKQATAAQERMEALVNG